MLDCFLDEGRDNGIAKKGNGNHNSVMRTVDKMSAVIHIW
jgi:hypothetical protein